MRIKTAATDYVGFGAKIDKIIKQIAAIEDTPAASPSNPSIRLTAFVTPQSKIR